MVERICARCATGNPSEQTYCGQCGALLSQPLARRGSYQVARRPIRLPVQWKETGKVVALGVATLAAEAGLAWLHRRQTSAARPTGSRPARAQPQAQVGRVIALGRRVSETWVGGQLQHRTDERVMWVVPDEAAHR